MTPVAEAAEAERLAQLVRDRERRYAGRRRLAQRGPAAQACSETTDLVVKHSAEGQPD